jgi:predicted transcriptional regulator
MIDFACKKFSLQEVIKCGLGLSKSEYKLLSFLLMKPKSYSSVKLSSSLHLDLSTVQRAVKNLFEKDLVIRSQENLDNGGYVFNYSVKNKEEIKKMIMEVITGWCKKVEGELESWA